MKPATNYVMVRPITPSAHAHGSGLLVSEIADVHLLKPCIGVVEAVCDDLYYGGYEVLAMGRNPAGDNLTRAQVINERSVNFDVDIEVKVSDIVLFRYIVHMDEDVTLPDGRMLIRYDDLIGKIPMRMETDLVLQYDVWSFDVDNLYPLNGAIFVEMRDTNDDSGVFDLDEQREQGFGKVVAEGMRVRSYLLWPEKGADFDVSLAGKTISFNNKAAVRIEEDTFRVLNTDTKYPLYYLYRAFVTGYFDG